MELPEAFLEHMKHLLGEEYEAFLESRENGFYRGLRVNTSKVEAEKFEEISPFPLEKISWTENGFYIKEDADASKHPYYGAGLYYLQEPSAMAPAAHLPIGEGDRVLDLCAAPGGKATELAARLRGTGLLVANDISNSRAKGLLKNLELFGAGNILVTSEEPQRLSRYFPEFFDKILVDAPCSGEGMLRKEPSMAKDWLEHGPAWYAPIQRQVLKEAARMLKPGGKLLYSTCTFSPMENEGTIAHLLESDASFQVLPLSMYPGFLPGRPDLLLKGSKEETYSERVMAQLKHCVRIYPHRVKGEGHFLALLEKNGEVSKKQEHEKESGKSLQKEFCCPEWEQFSKSLNISIDKESLRFYDHKLYSLPKALWQHSIRGLRFLRTGLYLGEAEKKRFTPSQALAMSLKKNNFQTVIDFHSSDSRVVRYLKGESLDVDDLLEDIPGNGWCLVCVDGYSLGWGKLVGGQLRNKYYPGWRWQ